MKYILSLDQGTTSSRAILFDQAGKIAGIAQQEFRQIYPGTGWVEHDPYAILASQLNSAVEVLGNARVRAGPAGRSLCRKLAEDSAEDTIRQKTGLLIDPYFSATKIAWILDNVEHARQRADQGKLAFGTVDSWLIWNLTGGKRHVTDRTNASRTSLYNIVEDEWDTELLKLVNIPQSMMPDVVWSSEKIGRAAATLGLGEIEIAGIAGDQQSALFGQLCTRPGDAKNTYGTGSFLLQNTGEQFMLSGKRLLTTLICSPARKLEYALEGSAFISGAVVQWLRDNMKFIQRSPDVEAIAKSVDGSNGVMFVPAFTGLGAPHWDPYASGLIIGIQRSTEIGHIARAAIESIAFQVAEVLGVMDQETKDRSKELRVDGGAAANDLLMQFQADLLGIPVRRPGIVETTALGAAYLAGLATGFWPDVETIAATREEGTIFMPRAGRAKMDKLQAKWRDAVERSKGWSQESA